MQPAFDLAALRAREFPWTAGGGRIYLNNAGTGPLPRRTIDTLHQWSELRAEPWKVSDHEMVFPALATVRAHCARLVGGHAEEIALVSNTSSGLSLAARALPMQPGDVVLASDREFPSVVYAWRAVERTRGIQLRLVPTRDGLMDEDALIAALDGPGVRALTVSWVSFATGYRCDLARLGAACRARGIFLVVDAMQGLGPLTLDADACNIDILACGGQKWLLSPWGTGLLYVRRDLIQRLEPPVTGWFVGPGSEDYTRLLEYDLRYFDSARRFEVMTLPVQDLIAMGRSLELLHEIGPAAIAAHVHALTGRVVSWAGSHPGMRLVTPADPDKRAGIVSVAPPDPAAASARRREAGILHSLREGAIRLAPHFYNTADEVDAALKVLEAT